MLAVAAAAVALLLIVRLGPLRWPVLAVFPLLLLLMACPTVFWWAWVDERLAGPSHAPAGDSRPASAERGHCVARRWRVSRGLMGAYAIAVMLPVVTLLLGWRGYDRLPVPALMWVMTWHVLLGVAGLLALGPWIAYLILRGVAARVAPRGLRLAACASRQPQAASQAGRDARPPSRRAFLTGALATAPVVIAGSAVAAGLRQQGRFAVRRIEMQLPRLPDRLRGLTITHLSDLHVGRLFRPEHLPAVVEAVNKLDSDLIAITGDTVDHSLTYLPEACDAFRQLHSGYGRYVVIGNHDLIDSSGDARAYLRWREPNFLCDDRLILSIGGERMQIVGLDWSRYDTQAFGRPGHRERVAAVMAGAEPEVFTLALAHHPHAFDALTDAGVDLTLAGHTHGGQLMLTPPGSPHPIGGGSLLFRYIWGEYRRGDAALYLTSGVGNWFPVRINAPAELVQIRLT
ncbi:MAG: metallophosphoesterase [Planctomycetes bacterium]|nr:metallophosphoesterase [Planctomycetota bacterium]